MDPHSLQKSKSFGSHDNLGSVHILLRFINTSFGHQMAHELHDEVTLISSPYRNPSEWYRQWIPFVPPFHLLPTPSLNSHKL